MDGIEKITARIRADADAELAQLREQTEAQILEIQAQAKAQMDQERTAILARGRRAAEERLERLKSAAQLERRKLELAAKQEVPFSTVFEVLIMLLAFEVLQEAGLRLPSPIGATVSILGGLVVGNAAVEARIVSPAVLIAVAIAGVAGYTMPSQDMAAALRLWRFLLAILASAAGLFGLAAGCAGLIYHLASLETFGVPYLAPFTAGAGQPQGHPNLLRPPLPRMKWRDGARHTENRRNQR